MMINDIVNAIVILILVVLVALSSYNIKTISSNKKYRVIDKVIADAVFLAEKAGTVQNLSGLAQKTYAFQYAQKQLQKLGFTSLSEEQINAKIERVWAKNSDVLNSTYSQQKQDSQGDASDEIEKQKQDLVIKQSELALASAKLDADKKAFKDAKQKASQLLSCPSISSDDVSTTPKQTTPAAQQTTNTSSNGDVPTIKK